MEDYKELNKGLIEQNLQLEKLNTHLQEERTLLRNQLLAERRKEIWANVRFTQTIVENFKEVLAVLEPECDLLKLLRNYDNEDDNNDDVFSDSGKNLKRRKTIMLSPNNLSACNMSIATEEIRVSVSNNKSDIAEGTITSPCDISTESPERINTNDAQISLQQINNNHIKKEAAKRIDCYPNAAISEKKIDLKTFPAFARNKRSEQSPIVKRSTKKCRTVLQDISNFGATAGGQNTSSATIADYEKSNNNLNKARKHTEKYDEKKPITLATESTTKAHISKKLANSMKTAPKAEVTIIKEESVLEGRPRRSCRPKCLTEPNRIKKMRNEMVENKSHNISIKKN